MKVLVCGSRHFYDWRLLEQFFYEFRKEHEITEIISGCAAGADSLAAQYAQYNQIPFTGFPVDWKKHGKAAGPIRNTDMLKRGAPGLVLAFLAPNSRGTKHMIEIAQKAGIPVEIINVGS